MNTPIEDILNDITNAHNKLCVLDPSDCSEPERAALGRIWTDIQRLSAKLEIIVVMNSNRASVEAGQFQNPKKGAPAA